MTLREEVKGDDAHDEDAYRLPADVGRPDQTLFRFVDVEGRELEHYTYQSFAERTRGLAAYLFEEVGLRPGDRALLVYPPGLEVGWLRSCVRRRSPTAQSSRS